MPGGYVKGGYPKDSWKNDIQYVVPGKDGHPLTYIHLVQMVKKAEKATMPIFIISLN